MAQSPNMTYAKHPSQELCELFSEQPYQGQHPEKASVIILGKDANYSQYLTHHPFFSYILEYHKNGVTFWEKYGIHHPFLHTEYPFPKTRGGVPYHKNFSHIGLTKQSAKHISFIELLDIPTTGVSSKKDTAFRQMLSREHLQWIENVIFSGNKKIVLLNPYFIRNISYLNKHFSVFMRFPKKIPPLTTLTIENITLFSCYHFSARNKIYPHIGLIRDTISQFL